MTDDEGVANVDDLLNNLKIPAWPPDSSKWRKLEIAMKFIGKSKLSADHTKRRKSLKITPKERDQEKTSPPTKWGKVKSSLRQIAYGW